MKFILLFTVFISCFANNNGARILGVFSFPSISHQIVFRALMEELAMRGHDLVVITPDPVNYNKTEFTNLKQIDLHDISYKIYRENFNFVDIRVKNLTVFEIFENAKTLVEKLIDSELSVPEVQRLIQNPDEHFDLCIVEGIYPVMFAFKERFKSPLIIINSMVGFLQNFDAFGVPTHPILYRDVFSHNIEREVNVWQKMELIFQSLFIRYMYYCNFLPMYNRIAKKHFGSSLTSLNELENNADLLFLNYHPISVGIRPLVPGVIPLGSMHIKPPKPLPANLKKLLDESTEGVVYFSLGTNVQSSQLPANVRKIFLDGFRKMPYTVLWKWENTSLPDQPNNVIISKWFPQQDILGHPNIRAFITQGGQQSTDEAIHHKVPMLGIPFLADQEHNVNKMVYLGIGKSIKIDKITEDKLRETIIDLIENTSYRSNISKLHDLVYDQPQTSMERAVWWTEYVLRHGGARHLRSPGADISSWDYFMLDVFTVLLAILITSILILYALYLFFRSMRSNIKLKIS